MAASFVYIIHLSGKLPVRDFRNQQVLETQQRAAVMQMQQEIQSCLNQGLESSLLLVGQSGGIIFNSSTGTPYSIPFPVPRENITRYGNYTFVAYQLYNPISGRLIPNYGLLEDPPLYPCLRADPSNSPIPESIGISCYYQYNHSWKFTVSGAAMTLYQYMQKRDKNSSFTGFRANSHAISFLPSLCSQRIRTNTDYTCPWYRNNSFSIESQIMNYTQNHLITCVNLTHYASYGVTYNASAIEMEILFENDGTKLITRYPITVRQNLSVQSITNFYNFTTRSPARLNTLYTFARRLIQQEIENITFNYINDGQVISNATFGGQLELRRRRIANDIYRYAIIDHNIRNAIGREYYYFQFLGEGRNPALDYYHKYPSAWDSHSYDVYVQEGEFANITPKGYDPDDENLTFTYTGWRATWSDTYTGPACGQSGVNQFAVQQPYGPLDPNEWQTSPEYLNGCTPEGILEKQRCAAIGPTGCADIGLHTVSVIATDPDGLIDQQDMVILVDDKPRLRLHTNNTYTDSDYTTNDIISYILPPEPPYVNDFYASLEDPFIIDASPTVDVVGASSHVYSIKDLNETSYQIITIVPPGYPVLRQEPWKPSILTMRDYPVDHINFTKTGTHSISVSFQDAGGGRNYAQDIFKIEVLDCLPHRAPGTAPYPYYNFRPSTSVDDGYANPDDNDPYNSDHTCCKSGDPRVLADHYGTLLGAATICYSLGTTPANTVYGCASDFRDPAKFPQTSDMFNGGPAAIGGIGDILYYKFERECSGTRGNICNGIVRTNQLDLQTVNPATGGDRYCHHCSFGDSGFADEPQGYAWNPIYPSDDVSHKRAFACTDVYKCTADVNSPNGYNKLANDHPGVTQFPFSAYGRVWRCKATCSGAAGGNPSQCSASPDPANNPGLCEECPQTNPLNSHGCQHDVNPSGNDFCY
jgi:hypothetical protein